MKTHVLALIIGSIFTHSILSSDIKKLQTSYNLILGAESDGQIVNTTQKNHLTSSAEILRRSGEDIKRPERSISELKNTPCSQHRRQTSDDASMFAEYQEFLVHLQRSSNVHQSN